jgi:CheY-like chemotaxis protein
LLIDDDDNVRESLQMVLEDLGYMVRAAADGAIGIELALRWKPDLIICDMMMPKTSGFIVVETLKQQHFLEIPIVMLTGNESEHQRSYAEFVGVDEYITKPIRSHQLAKILERYLDNPNMSQLSTA